jgi:hypothetical protein
MTAGWQKGSAGDGMLVECDLTDDGIGAVEGRQRARPSSWRVITRQVPARRDDLCDDKPSSDMAREFALTVTMSLPA